ncbi:MAG: hypothetical protein HZB50_11795 [Chloroflexi bacterium]|nr:hypothetical protein [Chloroflexota bacterium]
MQTLPDQSQERIPQTAGQIPQSPFASAQVQAGVMEHQLKQAFNLAGSNFYSIAIFSLVNSVINFFQGSVYFPIGLGVTQIVDGFSYLFQKDIPQASTVIFAFNVILDLLIVGIVAIFGFAIKKQTTWLITLGGVLYFIDGLLLLVFEDWIGAGFHAYFLFRIWTSWQTIRKLSSANTVPSAIQ